MRAVDCATSVEHAGVAMAVTVEKALHQGYTSRIVVGCIRKIIERYAILRPVQRWLYDMAWNGGNWQQGNNGQTGN